MTEPLRVRDAATQAIDYLLIGHVVVDRLDDSRVILGGTAAYAGLTARNLGARVGIHTSASYEPGLVDTLYGALVARIPAEYTTCFVNREAEGGGREQLIESVAEKLSYEQLVSEWRHPSIVHLAPVCQEIEASIVERFPRSLIAVTPQGWLRDWNDDGRVSARPWLDAERVLARADVVVLSERDVPDGESLRAWIEQARLLVVTRGADGADVYVGGTLAYHASAFSAAAEVDATGAGDAFAAAFVWHLKQRGDLEQAADWAGCVASFVVEKRGLAGVPTLAAAEKRWKARHDAAQRNQAVSA